MCEAGSQLGSAEPSSGWQGQQGMGLEGLGLELGLEGKAVTSWPAPTHGGWQRRGAHAFTLQGPLVYARRHHQRRHARKTRRLSRYDNLRRCPHPSAAATVRLACASIVTV